jgi:S-adenosylmethionine synthetase
MRVTFASESVTEGHPDRVCDTISDSVLDAALMLDPKARVACETLVSENLTVITKEVSDVVLDNLDRLLSHQVMDRERDRLDSTVIFVNPTGAFLVGGPKADAGRTGWKIIVDTYGGMGRHGGGAFSGKDPSEVDRSAAYMARYIAKSVVAAELADGCEVQIAYVIGHAHPVCVRAETVNPSVSNDKISQAIEDVFDMRPAAIIERLNLLRPIYRATAASGHFGRPEFPWEASDRVVELQQAMR